MSDDRNRDESREPFRESGSRSDYDPNGNWGAERRRDDASGGPVPGIQGAPSGAGDGGFGPEGDYRGAGGAPNAEVIGQSNGDPDALAREARSIGRVRRDRETVGDNEARDDERDPRGASPTDPPRSSAERH